MDKETKIEIINELLKDQHSPEKIEFLKECKRIAQQGSFIPMNYLTNEEKFIFKSIKQDIKHCKTTREIKLLESKLDVLLERAITRYRRINTMDTVNKVTEERYRIAFRLVGFFIPHDEIAYGTGLSEDEVLTLLEYRNELYSEFIKDTVGSTISFYHWCEKKGYSKDLPTYVKKKLEEGKDHDE
ncbi:hypothetical protein LCM10_04735 [Rossellomorea aquimaris]|uniref:hypothetical protein n=1 Tax=Rossellomorea aquimaris TaxID=189382 RepID=UPI001CD1EC16|nr:hypothetical protein [Rossellomorea aquimaris]MCA1054285.1 hypothetical protein [Rossellomorea aquimaris]